MLAAVNQQTGQNYEKTPKTPKSSSAGSTSNRKILSTLVTSLDAIAGTLSSIDGELKKQNVMLGEALGTTVSNLQEIETSHEGLNTKFDAILGAFQAQTAAQEEAIDEAETDAAKAELAGTANSAGTFGTDPVGTGKGGGLGIPSWARRFLGRLWKRFAPKKLRAITRLFRTKVSRLLSRFAPRNVAKQLAQRTFGAGADAARRGAGRFVTRKALQIGGRKLAQSAAVKTTQEFVKKAAIGLIRPIVKRIPIFGGLIDFAVSLMLGEPVGRAAAKAVGATIGAGLGTLIPIPGVGTIAGGILGDWVGGTLYDAIVGNGGAPEEPTGDPQATESGAPTSFADQSGGLGVPDVAPPEEKETGGLTKPGYSILHGTEAIIPANETGTTDMMSPVGGALIAAASSFLTQAGPVAAPVAPMFKQTAGALTKFFDVPATLAQTNVGGSFAGVKNAVEDTKEKQESRSDYAGEVTDEKVDAPDDNKPTSMLGKLWNGITNLFGGRNQTPYNGDPDLNIPSEFSDVEFGNTEDLRFGLTGTTKMAVGGWSHAHFEAMDQKQSTLVKDVVPVVKKMASMGLEPETSDGRQFTTEMTDQELAELVIHGASRHTHSGSKPYAVDVNMPGFPLVPVELHDVRNTPFKGEGINALIKGTNTAIFHLSYQSDGYYKGGPVGLNGPEQITVGEEGPEIVMKNLVYEHKPIYEMLSAFNAATTSSQLVNAVERYAPEVLMYDEELEMEDDEPIIIIQQAPAPPPVMSGGGTVIMGGGKKTNASKTLLMQKLQG